MVAKSLPFQFQLFGVLCSKEGFNLDFTSSSPGLWCFPLLSKDLHQSDIFVELYWLLASVSTVVLQGKDKAVTMTKTVAFPTE